MITKSINLSFQMMKRKVNPKKIQRFGTRTIYRNIPIQLHGNKKENILTMIFIVERSQKMYYRNSNI